VKAVISVTAFFNEVSLNSAGTKFFSFYPFVSSKLNRYSPKIYSANWYLCNVIHDAENFLFMNSMLCYFFYNLPTVIMLNRLED
jgi:hypothetical protein